MAASAPWRYLPSSKYRTLVKFKMEKDYYLKSWNNLLTHLLSWSKEQIVAWIQETQKDQELADPESLLYHAPPVSWIIMPIVLTELKTMPSDRELLHLRKMMLSALDAGSHDFTVPTDWAYYRRRVQEVVRDFQPRHSVGVADKIAPEFGFGHIFLEIFHIQQKLEIMGT